MGHQSMGDLAGRRQGRCSTRRSDWQDDKARISFTQLWNQCLQNRVSSYHAQLVFILTKLPTDVSLPDHSAPLGLFWNSNYLVDKAWDFLCTCLLSYRVAGHPSKSCIRASRGTLQSRRVIFSTGFFWRSLDPRGNQTCNKALSGQYTFIFFLLNMSSDAVCIALCRDIQLSAYVRIGKTRAPSGRREHTAGSHPIIYREYRVDHDCSGSRMRMAESSGYG